MPIELAIRDESLTPYIFGAAIVLGLLIVFTVYRRLREEKYQSSHEAKLTDDPVGRKKAMVDDTEAPSLSSDDESPSYAISGLSEGGSSPPTYFYKVDRSFLEALKCDKERQIKAIVAIEGSTSFAPTDSSDSTDFSVDVESSDIEQSNATNDKGFVDIGDSDNGSASFRLVDKK